MKVWKTQHFTQTIQILESGKYRSSPEKSFALNVDKNSVLTFKSTPELVPGIGKNELYICNSIKYLGV